MSSYQPKHSTGFHTKILLCYSHCHIDLQPNWKTSCGVFESKRKKSNRMNKRTNVQTSVSMCLHEQVRQRERERVSVCVYVCVCVCVCCVYRRDRRTNRLYMQIWRLRDREREQLKRFSVSFHVRWVFHISFLTTSSKIHFRLSTTKVNVQVVPILTTLLYKCSVHLL